MKPEDTYKAVNAGKMRRYRITKSNSKHFRHEYVDGKIELIAYCGPGSSYPGARNIIELLPSDAETKYAHMGLVEISGATTEIITDNDDDGVPEKVLIPDNWQDLPEDQLIELARKVSGKPAIKKLETAEKILMEATDGAGASDDE